MTISNRHGRCLEYMIVDHILLKTKCLSNQYTCEIQKRDKLEYGLIDEKVQETFQKGTLTIFDWLCKNFDLKNEIKSIIRLSDFEAKQGDVTDIRIETKNDKINLSTKFNHRALKHQRPPNLAVQCGYKKNSLVDVQYRKTYEKVIEDFIQKTKKLLPKAKLFSELKEKENDFINKHLYKPICDCVANFINDKCNCKGLVRSYFHFLVGNLDFYKIIVTSNNVEIIDFAKIIAPDFINATVRNDSYVDLNFSNNWKITMRLHTASSKIGNSVKFDTQLEDDSNLTKIELNF